MKQFEYTIKDALGIHARPAGSLAKLAKNYSSIITFHVNDKKAEATKLMAVMGLCVKHGTNITITVEGADEEEAFEAVKEFFENNL
ncbi:MAG: HPr family phosphocarrier protein [Lachnospiraceae bacterium]